MKVGDELRTKVCYNLFSRKGADRLQVRIIIMKMDTNNHSVFLLYYHLILVVKYRRNVFNDDMSDYARDIFAKIAPDYNITLLEWDHVFIGIPLFQKKGMLVSAVNSSNINSF